MNRSRSAKGSLYITPVRRCVIRKQSQVDTYMCLHEYTVARNQINVKGIVCVRKKDTNSKNLRRGKTKTNQQDEHKVDEKREGQEGSCD